MRNSMKNKLFYITYQSFPADTANSIQTISNLKYFSKNNYDVSLFFPLRERSSSDDFKIIDSAKFYIELVMRFSILCENFWCKQILCIPSF